MVLAEIIAQRDNGELILKFNKKHLGLMAHQLPIVVRNNKMHMDIVVRDKQ